MSQDGVWGSHFELLALCDVLGVEFALYMPNQLPIVVRGTHYNPNSVSSLCLAYFKDKHYASVRKLINTEKNPRKKSACLISDTINKPQILDVTKPNGIRYTKKDQSTSVLKFIATLVRGTLISKLLILATSSRSVPYPQMT